SQKSRHFHKTFLDPFELTGNAKGCLEFIAPHCLLMRWTVPMRILMANKYLYARAGAETYMLTVASELKARGHEVAFFGMAHPENTNLGPVCAFPVLEFGVKQSKFSTM